MATFSQRYPQTSLLRNLDIGTILVDSCSSGRKAVETVILAENHCFTIEQGGQNVTIVPGSVFGPFLWTLFISYLLITLSYYTKVLVANRWKFITPKHCLLLTFPLITAPKSAALRFQKLTENSFINLPNWQNCYVKFSLNGIKSVL